MDNLASRIIKYYGDLDFTDTLPDKISLLHPFKGNEAIMQIVADFYTKFYNDNNKRHLILGINPGRLGAGTTGIPFTDSKRIKSECGLNYTGLETHEPSSVFMYEMINAFGGPKSFYSKFYINSVCPLGFTITNDKGKEVNYNYYDVPALQKTVLPFIIWNIQSQIALGCNTDVCFCLGTGKNYKFLSALNEAESFFDKIVPLEHPRYIMQYKSKTIQSYIDSYLQMLQSCNATIL